MLMSVLKNEEEREERESNGAKQLGEEMRGTKGSHFSQNAELAMKNSGEPC